MWLTLTEIDSSGVSKPKMINMEYAKAIREFISTSHGSVAAIQLTERHDVIVRETVDEIAAMLGVDQQPSVINDNAAKYEHALKEIVYFMGSLSSDGLLKIAREALGEV